MYQKAKLEEQKTKEELRKLQARNAVLEKEKSIKELVTEQHEQLLEEIRFTIMVSFTIYSSDTFYFHMTECKR